VAKQERIRRQEEEREGEELARQIAEEKKLKALETWVSNWTRAQQLRDFIVALENVRIQKGA
jgi:hypothetical protein